MIGTQPTISFSSFPETLSTLETLSSKVFLEHFVSIATSMPFDGDGFETLYVQTLYVFFFFSLFHLWSLVSRICFWEFFFFNPLRLISNIITSTRYIPGSLMFPCPHPSLLIPSMRYMGLYSAHILDFECPVIPFHIQIQRRLNHDPLEFQSVVGIRCVQKWWYRD